MLCGYSEERICRCKCWIMYFCTCVMLESLFYVSFLTSNKGLVVGGLHEFKDIIARIVVFVVDLGVAEEAGVSPFFEDSGGDIKLLHYFLVGEYHFAG